MKAIEWQVTGMHLWTANGIVGVEDYDDFIRQYER